MHSDQKYGQSSSASSRSAHLFTYTQQIWDFTCPTLLMPQGMSLSTGYQASALGNEDSRLHKTSGARIVLLRQSHRLGLISITNHSALEALSYLLLS